MLKLNDNLDNHLASVNELLLVNKLALNKS